MDLSPEQSREKGEDGSEMGRGWGLPLTDQGTPVLPQASPWWWAWFFTFPASTTR